MDGRPANCCLRNKSPSAKMITHPSFGYVIASILITALWQAIQWEIAIVLDISMHLTRTASTQLLIWLPYHKPTTGPLHPILCSQYAENNSGVVKKQGRSRPGSGGSLESCPDHLFRLR